MTVTKCDMCGKDIPPIMYRMSNRGAHRFESDTGAVYDFCNDCCENLRNYVKTYFASMKSGTAVPLKEASE